MQHFKSRGDIGEIWFGEDAAERVVDWIAEKWTPQFLKDGNSVQNSKSDAQELKETSSADENSIENGESKNETMKPEDCSVLDLGTGNGHFLVQLVRTKSVQ